MVLRSPTPESVSPAPSPPEQLAAAFEALNAALARAELALERRAGVARPGADAAEELAAMQDDRSRLAQELAAALESQRALKVAHGEAERRVAAAATLVEAALGRAEALSGDQE